MWRRVTVGYRSALHSHPKATLSRGKFGPMYLKSEKKNLQVIIHMSQSHNLHSFGVIRFYGWVRVCASTVFSLTTMVRGFPFHFAPSIPARLYTKIHFSDVEPITLQVSIDIRNTYRIDGIPICSHLCPFQTYFSALRFRLSYIHFVPHLHTAMRRLVEHTLPAEIFSKSSFVLILPCMFYYRFYREQSRALQQKSHASGKRRTIVFVQLSRPSETKDSILPDLLGVLSHSLMSRES